MNSTNLELESNWRACFVPFGLAGLTMCHLDWAYTSRLLLSVRISLPSGSIAGCEEHGPPMVGGLHQYEGKVLGKDMDGSEADQLVSNIRDQACGLS